MLMVLTGNPWRNILFVLKYIICMTEDIKKHYPAFREWLTKKGETPLAFSRKSGISHITIYRAARGEPVYRSTAKKILRYTNKELTLQDFGYEK